MIENVCGQMLRVLVNAGATPVSAARAVEVLARGGTLREAEDELVLADNMLDQLVARIEAGELISSKSMSDREFLAPLLEPAANA